MLGVHTPTFKIGNIVIPSKLHKMWIVDNTIIIPTDVIGVDITAFGRKLTLFSGHPAFPLFT